jgi:serine protease Do
MTSMSPRARTIASFFTVAMASLLLGAFVTHQAAPQAALAVTEPGPLVASAPPAPAEVPRAGGALTLDTFRDVARRETPGVVNINTKKVVKRSRGRDPWHDFFGDDLMERFFGPGGRPEARTQRSLGSGFVVDKAGYILTNRHVIDGADDISVTLSTGKTYEAKLVGKDARTDVALLKVEPKEPLTVLALGDSDQTEVGEWVMAVGNPFGLWGDGAPGGASVTVGIVSFKGRNLSLGVRGTGVDMLQTDAAINPGNSGGPLFNTRGEVIGINTLIITQGVPQSAGVGFAVPINVAKEILPQLRDKGSVVRGWIGVNIVSVNEELAATYKLKEARGAVISEVTPDSPAEKAGLKPEDVVIGVDGRPVQGNNDLSRYIASKAPGSVVKLELLRAGAERTLSVTLGTFPDDGERTEEEQAAKGKLGMTLRDLTPDLAERLDMPRGAKGVVVLEVDAGEAAEEAGLQRGDVIVSVNGTPVSGVASFEEEIDRAKPDGRARLRVRREGSHLFLVLRLQ